MFIDPQWRACDFVLETSEAVMDSGVESTVGYGAGEPARKLTKIV
ncbi:MAG: hypothetical protein ACH344_09435 [Yersinia sp. (in: enterobacteria)]